MTTENIFAHERYVGATAYIYKHAVTIAAVENNRVKVAHSKGSFIWFNADGSRNSSGLEDSNSLSWIKQDFVLGDPPKPKLKPFEFKGIPALALVGTLDAQQVERWVIGYNHGNFICLNGANKSFLEAIMNQGFSGERTNLIESKCAWEVPE